MLNIAQSIFIESSLFQNTMMSMVLLEELW